MNIFDKVVVSTLVGTVAPALPFVILMLLTPGKGFFTGLMFIAIFVAAAHVVFLGIPAFFILKRMNLINRYSLTLSGFVTGLIPITVVNLFQTLGSDSATYLFFGVMGAVSGFAFWLAWSRLNSGSSLKPSQVGRPT